ncbi:MAG TPA: hypothetical protein VK157_12000 [Phycisphaerales bacterium]|nr:hypothetical protein [Phycisphaerales bacterium]
MGRLVKSAYAFAAAALVASACVHAQVLPLINPGFEDISVTLAPGEMINGMGSTTQPTTTRWPSPFQQIAGTPQTGVTVAGWRSFVPTPPAQSLVGVLNPSATINNQLWLTGQSGNHVAVAQAAFASQTLNVLLQPSTTYTVSFLAGIGRTDLSYSPRVALIAAADTTSLARVGDGVTTTLTFNPWTTITQEQFGVMLPFTFSYTTAAVLPADQANRYVGLYFVGSDGFPRVCFDDFRIEATPVPSAGPVALAVLAGCFVFAKSRKR